MERIEELWNLIEQESRGVPWSDDARFQMDIASPHLHRLVYQARHSSPALLPELLMRTVLELYAALKQTQRNYIDHLNTCATPAPFIVKESK